MLLPYTFSPPIIIKLLHPRVLRELIKMKEEQKWEQYTSKRWWLTGYICPGLRPWDLEKNRLWGSNLLAGVHVKTLLWLPSNNKSIMAFCVRLQLKESYPITWLWVLPMGDSLLTSTLVMRTRPLSFKFGFYSWQDGL